jgi:hypothetical protein
MIVDRAGTEYDTRWQMRLESDTDGLGWCGCGTPERAVRPLRAYLEVLALRDGTASWVDGRASASWEASLQAIDALGDAGALVAYVADAAGWTEHGSSVVGAWLTDLGRAVLEDLRTLEETP